MKIRKAKKEDLKDIIEIFRTESRKSPYYQKLTNKKIIETFKPALKKKEIWVAVIDEKIVGFIWGGLSSVSKKIVYIDDLWVTKKYQREGIGKKLLALVEKFYKNKEVHTVRFTAYTKSKAFGFYKKLNYRPSKKLVLLEKKL
ncbi:GNAT family N-acetyltransferase [archaeon]|nr:GNAT family N-acetyltransferase [archaeon]